MNAPSQTPEFYRFVGGEVAGQMTAASPTVRVESFVRRSGGLIDWRFRQPDFALFWFREGFHAFDIDVEGTKTRVKDPAHRGLGLFPGGAVTSGEFVSETICEYDVIFIDRAFVEGKASCVLDRELVGFDEPGIRHSLIELTSWKADASFGLMAEGWALQTLARLTVALGEVVDLLPARGGLSPSVLRRIDEFISSNLHATIGMKELAAIANVSVRHFARAFKQSTGRTPARFMFDKRLELAKRLLAESGQTITEIALVCGFSHAQHLSNSFRRSTGRTPSEFRQFRRG
ncbi:AraC family transcriptional regulator [Sphingobium yanoikuyae]|uniref:AraC family transcriptional regulator n=1 Tax=Sphingobium yanoikuyae TaxID=13690 RepID=UPI00155388AB|nr:AraC family transcriptional regulator [Sphingobium yanoikuyae]